jgi:luciferase family oxidoreductase group 1
LLEGLYPGRVDLGIGRAPGGMPLASRALRNDQRRVSDERFPDVLRELAAYLEIGEPLGADHPFHGLRASPHVKTAPELWLLGSSGFSAAAAAELGAGFSFAHFINGDGGQGAVRDYLAHFRPGPLGHTPRVSVCVTVLCADDDETAERHASLLDLRLLLLERGEFSRPFPKEEEAAAYPYTEYDRARMRDNRNRMIVGGPEKVKRQLTAFAENYHTDEVLVTCFMSEFRDRVRCYELLAQLFLEP